MWARIGMLLAAVLASALLTGAGQLAGSSDGPEDRVAAHAVAVLTGRADAPAEEAIPADFTEVTGLETRMVWDPDGRGRVIRVDGDCSGPLGSRYGFGPACQTHDFGYALLRYATAKGGELGPWARRAVDDLLAADLRRQCDLVDGGLGCRTLAGLGEAVVKANSWRQGYGNPGPEAGAPYLVSGVLVLAAIAGPPVTRRLRRGTSGGPRIQGIDGSRPNRAMAAGRVRVESVR